MALKVREISPNVFSVKQTTHGWTDDTHSTFYHDLNRNLVSEKIDFPDEMITRTMTETDIDWFEKYHRKLAIRAY